MRPRAAAVSAGRPMLSWSCSSNWKPARLPMPRIAGGLNASTVAFAIWPRARAQPAHHAVGGRVRRLALVPRLERDEHQRAVGCVDAELRSVRLEDDRDLREVFQYPFDAARHALGVRERGAFGQLDRHVEIADVLVGQEARRNRLVREVRRDEPDREQAEHDGAVAHQRRQQGVVAVAARVDHAVDRAVEAGAVDGVLSEQQRGERRRERERVEQRDRDRAGDRQRELLVEQRPSCPRRTRPG